MQRFFVEAHQIDEAGGSIRMTGNDVNHVKNVLRMKIGEEIHISDGDSREYCCRIADMDEEILLEILSVSEPDYELPGRICLFQGLPKADKMELIIQKAVELGAAEIIPVQTKRCVVRLDEKKAGKKNARWQQIAESAAKQSKRIQIPKVHEVCSFREALQYAGELDVRLIPYELAEGMTQTRNLIDQIQPGQSVGIFIGPEGGFEEQEIQEAMDAGAVPITLGRRILRTETAGMALLSVLMFRLERDS